jgi:hypothetical protein
MSSLRAGWVFLGEAGLKTPDIASALCIPVGDLRTSQPELRPSPIDGAK